MRNRPVYDVVALLSRCGIGAVFLVHGWQKVQVGLTSTGHSFNAMGIPFSTGAAIYSTFVELLGGAALILGVMLPVMGTLLILDTVASVAFANSGHVMLQANSDRGVELALVLGLATLLLTAGAAGRITVDHWLFGRRSVPLPQGGRFTGRRGSEKPPKLVSEMVSDTNRDVVVAGKRTSTGKTPAKKSASSGSASKGKDDADSKS